MTAVVIKPLPFGARYQVPSRIVVHCMAEHVDYEGKRIHAWELLYRLGLSSHVLLTPNGVRIVCRREQQGAFHAKGHNTNSLGIEVLVPGVFNLEQLQERTKSPYVEPAQFEELVKLVLEWRRAYHIRQIDRHSDLDPERRWFDPGEGFPWAELLKRTWSY